MGDEVNACAGYVVVDLTKDDFQACSFTLYYNLYISEHTKMISRWYVQVLIACSAGRLQRLADGWDDSSLHTGFSCIQRVQLPCVTRWKAGELFKQFLFSGRSQLPRVRPLTLFSPKQLQRRHRPDLTPSVLMVDGNGVLHPRKCGVACHIGIDTGIPTL